MSNQNPPAESNPQSVEMIARQCRLAVITNGYHNGYISIDEARDLLQGPLSPGKPETVFDDSALLGDPDGLQTIKAQYAHKD